MVSRIARKPRKKYGYRQRAEVESEVQRVIFSPVVKKHDIGDDGRLDGLEGLIVSFALIKQLDCSTSAGPAPIPFSTQAPMKLPYVVALALQIALARQTRVDAR